jgi:hypothetical protein
MVSFDLKDGFCAMAIVLKQRDFRIFNVRGQLYRLARLPMGWSLNPLPLLRLHEHLHRASPPTIRPRRIH